jgi:hypothetical protein
MEDLESCIIGFIELCSKLLTHENNVNIFLTPALINSDVVENEFNQQRSTYNGANTNPNALQYFQFSSEEPVLTEILLVPTI